MSTRAQLRQSIRDELNDNSSVKLWSDAQLNQYIVEAVRAYSRELPKETTTTISVVADQEAYSLPSDFDRAIRVEQPDDRLREHDPTERSAWSYRIFASQIILDPKPTSAGSTQNVTLSYLARYAEPAADADVIATPASDDDMLIRLACALALRWISTDEAKRQRFERTRGTSAMGMADAYDQDARRALALRKRRVRMSVLVPTGGGRGRRRNTDPGPG